jgi:hypothetical protein
MRRPRMVSGARALHPGAGRHAKYHASDTARTRALRERDFTWTVCLTAHALVLGRRATNPPLLAVCICRKLNGSRGYYFSREASRAGFEVTSESYAATRLAIERLSNGPGMTAKPGRLPPDGRHQRSKSRHRRGASLQITIHCFAFIGGSRIFVCLKLMRLKPFPVRLVPMLSLSDLSRRCGASTSIGPYFGIKAILSGSSRITRPITTNIGCHSGLAGATPAQRSGVPHRQWQNLSHIPGGNIAKAYFRPQLPPELEFDTDRI